MHAPARLVIFLACAAAITGCSPLSSHPLAVKTMESVRRSPRVAEAIGQPVECGPVVRGTVNEIDGIARLTFEVRGTKGKGVVAVDGKKTRGEWGMTLLELRPATGDRVSLAAEIETDAPKFDPSATPTPSKTPAAPPGDIDIPLPAADAER